MDEDRANKNNNMISRKAYFNLTAELDEPLDLYQHLPFQISVVSNLLQLNRDAVIRDIVDLEPRELRVILNIGSYMPIKSADIAYQSRLDSYTVTRAVKKLNDLELVDFKFDKANKKTKLLILTKTGIHIYSKLCKEIRRRETIIENGLAEEERAVLMGLLTKLETNLELMLAKRALNKLQKKEVIAADQKEIIRWSNKSRG